MGLNIPKQPSVPLMPNMADVLIVSFDKHQGDETLMMVTRKNMDDYKILKVFKEDEAEELYKELVGWDDDGR